MKKLLLALLFLLPTVASAQQFIPLLKWTSATGTNATTTALFSTKGTFTTICLTGDTCRTTWPSSSGGISWPFTKQSSGAQATTTVMQWIGGFLSSASSTINSSLYVTDNIGIGTSNPGSQLSISNPTGGGQLQLYVNSNGHAVIGNTQSGRDLNIQTAGTGDMFFQVGGSDRLTIIDNGNSGFGIGAPVAKVHIAGSLLVNASSTIGGSADSSGLTIFGGATTTGQSLHLSSTTLQNFTALNSTTTNSTSTNLYVSGTLSAANVYDTGLVGATCLGENGGLIGTSNCVSSVNSAGSTLTVSPTTGAVDVSLKLNHANDWTALQTFTNSTSTLFSSQYASTTILCISNDCRTAWPTSSMTFSWPWTKQANGDQATSTVIRYVGGFASNASSSVNGLFQATNATTTLFSTTIASTSQFQLSGKKDTILSVDANGWVVASSSIGNNQLQSSTISGISLGSNLAALTAGATLTSGGTYTGATARTFDIDLTHANTWTGLQQFSNSTSTLFSSQYASTTILCVSNDCRTTWPAALTFAWPFTKQAGGEQATSTVMSFLGGLFSNASSTINSSLLVAGSTTLQAFVSGAHLALGSTTLQAFTANNATTSNQNFTGNHITFSSTYVSASSTASFNVASSTLVNGASFNRASTTLTLAPWLENRQVVGASCMATSSAASPGGVIFRVGGKTNTTIGLYCDANFRTYTFTAVQVAAFSDFLSLTMSAASNTPDRVSINIVTQKVSD